MERLAPSVRDRLSRAGFRTVADVAELSPVQLAHGGGEGLELRCTPEDAMGILQSVQRVHSEPVPAGVSAVELLKREAAATSVRTGAAGLDGLLGTGVPTGKITEFCGAPGIGKTQLGIQLAINVQFPVQSGGAGGDAIYIDTEGSFIVERVVEIAEAAVAAATADGGPALSVEKLLGGIRYFRVHDHFEQVALLNLLESILQANPTVKLVVIDSIAFHFRYDHGDMGVRARLLNGMAQVLIKLAHKHQLAVVLMNQMTTKLRGHEGAAVADHAHLVPALGDSWGHACTIRVILSWLSDARQAFLLKSPTGAQASVEYAVTAAGIRDAGTRLAQAASAEHDDDARSGSGGSGSAGSGGGGEGKRVRVL